jgi:hypothetical protein
MIGTSYAKIKRGLGRAQMTNQQLKAPMQGSTGIETISKDERNSSMGSGSTCKPGNVKVLEFSCPQWMEEIIQKPFSVVDVARHAANVVAIELCTRLGDTTGEPAMTILSVQNSSVNV